MADPVENPYDKLSPDYQMASAEVTGFGLVLLFWSQFELTIEMVVQRTLGLTLEQTCIICGPLGAGAKISLVMSLLKDKPEHEEFCAAVREFQTYVGRNALAHGFPTFDKLGSPWVMVSREVKNGLAVKVKTLRSYTGGELEPRFDRVVNASGFTDDQIHRYGQAIARLARQS